MCMDTKYFIVEERNTVIKLIFCSEGIKTLQWKDGRWIKPLTDYSGMYSGELSVDEIKEGDETGIKLGLQK